MNVNRVDAMNTNGLMNDSYLSKSVSSDKGLEGKGIRAFTTKDLNEAGQKKMEEQLKKVNDSIKSSSKELRFKYNDEAKQLYVEILDSTTQEVLTSLPPEFLIELSVKMKEMVGLFLDEKI